MQPRPAMCCTVATPVQQGATPVATVELATSVDNYLTARRWLDADALPAVESAESKADASNVSAVCVILRLDGRLVGTGENACGDETMLRRAVGEAVAKALGDETIRSVRDIAGDRVTHRLALEVELAGPLSPLLGRTIADACIRVVPGRDGLAVRRGDHVVRAFPSRMSLTDTADRPAGVITSLLADAGLPPKDLNEFATDERVSLARFQTMRLRGASPAASPSVIERGGRTVDMLSITKSTSHALVACLTARLCDEIVEIPRPPDAGDAVEHVWLRGTFDPTHDRFSPVLASPRDAALAILALMHAGRSPQLDAPMRERARSRALALLRSIQAHKDKDKDKDKDNDDDKDRSLFVESICVMAAAELGFEPEQRAQRAEQIKAQLKSRSDTNGSAESIDMLYACVALSSAGNQDDRMVAVSAAHACISQVGSRGSDLARATLPLALIVQDAGFPTSLKDGARELLSRFAAAISSLQIGSAAHPVSMATGGFPEDLLGGLVPPGPQRNDSQTQVLLPYAALALAKTEAFRDMQPMGVRFLSQHVADEPWIGGFRSPELLKGRVRDSLGGNECSSDRLALALLFALAASENG